MYITQKLSAEASVNIVFLQTTGDIFGR